MSLPFFCSAALPSRVWLGGGWLACLSFTFFLLFDYSAPQAYLRMPHLLANEVPDCYSFFFFPPLFLAKVHSPSRQAGLNGRAVRGNTTAPQEKLVAAALTCVQKVTLYLPAAGARCGPVDVAFPSAITVSYLFNLYRKCELRTTFPLFCHVRKYMCLIAYIFFFISLFFNVKT